MRSILFVEDHEDTRELICELLTASGFVVTGVGSAERAIELLREQSFDVLITDHWLDPGETGTWLLHLAAREGLLGPAIMCTAERSIGELPPGVAVVKKPVDVDVLLAEIDRACRTSEQRAQRTERDARDGGAGAPSSGSSPASARPAVVDLVLYVTRSNASTRGLRNLRRVLDRYPSNRIELGIVDVTHAPLDAADVDRVAFTPMLVKRGPGPRERLVGDLSDAQALVDMLDRAGLTAEGRVA